nr:reverse transcriptase domain-containing protein [Tanacetum cinerariifolium]
MGRDTVQLETAVSTISQEYLLEFTSEYGISKALHPKLLGPGDRIVDFPEGKVGVYTKFFEFANFRLPLSQFLFDILDYYQIHLSQLSVIGAAKNNCFFWVDERVFPTIVDWRTSAPKDGMPTENTYSPKGCDNTEHTPYPNPETTRGTTLLSMVKSHILPGRQDMDLFNLIRAPNPTEVKTGSRPRAAHEVPLLTITANRMIEMEDPTAATDSSGVPSTIERSPLDFANENPSQQSTGPEDQEAAAPEVPPLENVTTMRIAPEAGLAERVDATDPPAVSGEEKLKATFEEFKQYEDNRVEQRCAKMNALSIDFDKELYPHMLTAIACRRWMIVRGLRLAVMKCDESIELRQAFTDVVLAGIAKGLSEGLKHGVEHGQAKLDLEAIEAYDPEAEAKYITALHALKNLKYPIVDQLKSLKDAQMDVIMASLHLESDTGDEAPYKTTAIQRTRRKSESKSGEGIKSRLVIPTEIGIPTYRTAAVDVVNNDEELRLNLDLLKEWRERAAICEAKGKSKMTKYYNARVRGVTFKPGDFVYRNNDASHAVAGGKLGPKWEGPYEVTEALGMEHTSRGP